MGKYFGTDGIRGVANAELSAMLAIRCGIAAALTLGAGTCGNGRVTALIGRDTRISGDMLEAALSAGLASGGADVISLGVLPTPAIAYLTKSRKADLGIVISASHNSFEHNGIKIFNSEGYKLSDALEAEIERLIDSPEELAHGLKTFADIGNISQKEHSGEREYIDYLLSLSEGFPQGIRVAADCANGASFRTARVLFARLGVEAYIINDEPTGININESCGSTHMESLLETVISKKFDIGFAFDGDADRLLIIDENGEMIDGDVILALCARDMARREVPGAQTVVGTVMTNSGFHDFANANGLTLLRSDVGDRNVLELMRNSGSVIGGETSGHTIFINDATTGDGQLTALKFLGLMRREGKSASELAASFRKYPQITKNIKVNEADKKLLMDSPKMKAAIAKAENDLENSGKVLVRPSGTEALIRITVEAETEERANKIANEIASTIP